MIQLSRCRDFTRAYDYGRHTVVRVFNKNLGLLGGRHAWVTIQANGKMICRRVMGSGGTGLSISDFELDYDSRLELGIVREKDAQGFYECDATIRRACLSERISAQWHHPNHEYRVSYKFAAIGLGLGCVALILGLISLYVSISSSA